jgi:hypothetical protein
MTTEDDRSDLEPLMARAIAVYPSGSMKYL